MYWTYLNQSSVSKEVILLAGINSVSSNFGTSFYGRFFNNASVKEIKNPERFNKIGQMLASPHWNRVAIGVAALSTQPLMDKFNPKVDEDTANVSALRTISKNVCCMSSGFVIRGAVYKLTEKYAHATEKEGSTLLTPRVILKEANKELRNTKLKVFKNAFSTVSALAIMTTFTNILIDAPLVTMCSNKLIEEYYRRKDEVKRA